MVSLFFLIVRLYARWRSFKRFWFDDALVVFAWLLAFSTAIIWQIIAGLVYQSISIANDNRWPRPRPADWEKYTEYYLKGIAVVYVFFYTSLWAVKIAFLLFFRRLRTDVAGLRVLWWITFAVTVATYLVCIGDTSYHCLVDPVARIRQTCSDNRASHHQRLILGINCTMDVLTDYMSKLMVVVPLALRLTNKCSHGNTDKHALEGPNAVTEKNGSCGTVFTYRDHHYLCHHSRDKHYHSHLERRYPDAPV